MIEVKKLTKSFGKIRAVDSVSFNVEKGEILGFLGPNGAGKSTTMRMITGFLPPTSGTAVIGGYDISDESISARERIGYLPENAPVYPDMTVNAYLDFCAEIRGFSGSERKKKVEETVDRCFLSNVEFQTIGTLSKGYRQRVCFAQSIIHDPEYLIFDEPTDGLDPNQKHEVRMMMREMSEQKAILLSTHILDEVEAVCTRIIIIANGCIVADDSPEHLKTRSSLHGAVTLKVADSNEQAVKALLEGIEDVKGVEILEMQNDVLNLRAYPVDGRTPIADKIIAACREKKYSITGLFVEQGRLDEVFRNITT
ncbi:MAG: ABC transporter ATP-binding protein [Desulfobacterales bacterium]